MLAPQTIWSVCTQQKYSSLLKQTESHINQCAEMGVQAEALSEDLQTTQAQLQALQTEHSRCGVDRDREEQDLFGQVTRLTDRLQAAELELAQRTEAFEVTEARLYQCQGELNDTHEVRKTDGWDAVWVCCARTTSPRCMSRPTSRNTHPISAY